MSDDLRGPAANRPAKSRTTAPVLPVGASAAFVGPAPGGRGEASRTASGDEGARRHGRAGDRAHGRAEESGRTGAAPSALGGASAETADWHRPPPLDEAAYREQVARRAAELERLDVEGRLLPGPGLLVALDVDGTILDLDGRVSERVMSAIDRLRERGSQVVIATGRGIQAALPVARHVGLDEGWLVCANGALTLRLDPALPEGYEIAESRTFDPSHALEVLAAAVPDGILAVEDLDSGFRATRAFPDGELIESLTVVGLEELRAAPVTRVILRAPGMEVERFSRAVAGSGLHSVEYAIGWTAWLDVAPQGVTKASALEDLARRLGTGAERAIAVGDGSNDVEMLRWAGLGAVMGSAPQEVKDLGDLLTAPVWHDGCAAVLEAVLGRPGGLRGAGGISG